MNATVVIAMADGTQIRPPMGDAIRHAQINQVKYAVANGLILFILQVARVKNYN